MKDKDSKLLEEAYEGMVNEYYGRRRRYDEDAPPSSPISVNIALWDEDTETEVEPEFEVSFSVKPTEYEGGYLFYQGGIDIEDVKLEELVKFGDKVYPTGTDLEDLLEYTDWDSIDQANEWLQAQVSGQGVEPPVHRYRASWR